MSSWLHDSGSSWWLSCQEGKGREEEEVGVKGLRKLEGVEKKGEACGDGGLMLLILIFHQLGLLAIICCTGELWTTPLFMFSIFNPLRILLQKKREKKERNFLVSIFSFSLLILLPKNKSLCRNFERSSWGWLSS